MSKLGLLPIALVILAASTFVVSYIIAVADGHVAAAFPYISDTGSERPESSIFGQFLNITAFLAFFTMYIRYKAVQAIAMIDMYDPWLRRMNRGSFALGCISSFGCSMVANFQEGTDVEIVHLVGAALTFGLGVIYTFLQTAMSFHMQPRFNGKYVCRARLAVCSVAMISLIITLVAASIALHEWHKKAHGDKFKWSSNDPGYAAHLVSTAGEWIMAMSFLSFFLTYTQEFYKFEVEIVARPLVRHLDDEVEPSEPNERTKLLV